MTLALGKIVTMEQVEKGVEELAKVKVSMFYVELRNSEGKLDHIEIIRLKDKLGTRQLPTAELLLKGVKAHLISEEGQGVKAISKMLLLTRMYNSSTAVGLMRRGLLLAKDYAEKRTIGKQKLSKLPLQLRVISNLEVISRGNLIFFVKMSHFLSK
jgi:alkylation response protein AidB-like acyl-CoA dehydrogenase